MLSWTYSFMLLADIKPDHSLYQATSWSITVYRLSPLLLNWEFSVSNLARISSHICHRFPQSPRANYGIYLKILHYHFHHHSQFITHTHSVLIVTKKFEKCTSWKHQSLLCTAAGISFFLFSLHHVPYSIPSFLNVTVLNCNVFTKAVYNQTSNWLFVG
jgi:hypothetical protein